MGYPLVLKIVSPGISYKSDAGGVALGIRSEEELRDQYARMMDRVRAFCPDAEIRGVTVQKMVEGIDYEVIVGSKKDEDFGSIILFGMGGVGVQIFQDFSIGLPPLNQALARKLMEETRVYRLLQGYRGKPPADLTKLEEIILILLEPHRRFPRDRRDGYQPHRPCRTARPLPSMRGSYWMPATMTVHRPTPTLSSAPIPRST